MIFSLSEHELKQHTTTESLPVYDVDDPDGERYYCQDDGRTYAEASNSFRLMELLRRKHYRPVAAVRHRDGGSVCIRVYFLVLHRSELVEESQKPFDRVKDLI